MSNDKNDKKDTKEIFKSVYDKLIECGLIDAARDRLEPDDFEQFEKKFKDMSGVYDDVISAINNMSKEERDMLLVEAFQKRGLTFPRNLK